MLLHEEFLHQWSAKAPRPDTTFGTVIGTVRDPDENEPLSSVRVRLMKTRHEAISDVCGIFRFSQVPPGRYTLHLHPPEYGIFQTTFDIVPGGVVLIDATVRDPRLVCAERAREEISKGVVELWITGLLREPWRHTPVEEKYGFRYVPTGCFVSDGMDEHQRVVRAYLAGRNGAGWEKQMEIERQAWLDTHPSTDDPAR
jgi:hypothetical protein